MSGDNPSGGDDQQGRPRRLGDAYVAGFVDGEGSFSVTVHPHPTTRARWLIGPTFQVYQHRDHALILELIREFFGCGRITPKGPSSQVLTYSVYRRSDLANVIVPFFERNPLVTKGADLRAFAEIVRRMEAGEHATDAGFRRIVESVFSMNQRGKQRRYSIDQVLGTLRDCTPSGIVLRQ